MSGIAAARASECSLRADGCGFGDSNGRAVFRYGFNGLLFVQFRPIFREVAGDGSHRHCRLADYGAQRAPFFAHGVFLHARGDAHALGIDFGVEDFGFIRLAGIEQAALRFGAILSDVVEIPAGIEHFLGGEYSHESHPYSRFYTNALLVRFDGGEFRLVREDVTAEFEFASGNDGLLNEEALLAAAH